MNLSLTKIDEYAKMIKEGKDRLECSTAACAPDFHTTGRESGGTDCS